MKTPPPSSTVNSSGGNPSALDHLPSRSLLHSPEHVSDRERPSRAVAAGSPGHEDRAHCVTHSDIFEYDQLAQVNSKQENAKALKTESFSRLPDMRISLSTERSQLVKEARAELPSGNPHLPGAERFPTIAEESLTDLSRSRNAFTSPSATGSQTASTESANTVRGSAMPQTLGDHQVSMPSYPFPPMSIEPFNPTDITPTAIHKPFTALSPTAGPPPLPLPQSSFSQQRYRQFIGVSKNPDASYELPQVPAPDLYQLSLMLQSEPGLDRWWHNLGQILRDNFGVERAILAVPSDTTDLENVPWAQMATFNPAEEDSLSKATNEGHSTQSSANDLAGQDEGAHDTSNDWKNLNPELGGLNWIDTPPVQGRPTLESRHSFSGFAGKVEPTSMESKAHALPHPKHPGILRSTSYMSPHAERHVDPGMLREVRLSSEALRTHLASQASKSPQSLMFSDLPGRGSCSRIFPVAQTLEMESQPLLTSVGVVRVLERGNIVHITRQYLDETPSVDQKLSSRRVSGLENKVTWPTRNSKAFKHKVDASGLQLRAPSSGEGRSLKRPRSHTSGSSKSSSTPVTEKERTQKDEAAGLVYEDYEQSRASAWSQSPAPSPAVQTDPDVNPFFTQVSVDEEAFSENPPAHDYSVERQVEAIGIDKASSIVHIPLIHPFHSKPNGPHRLRLERGRGTKNKTQGHFSSTVPENKFQDSFDADKKTPIAILSILSASVPFPLTLSSALQDLAPHMATSFYAAQQHTNLEKTVAAHSMRRLRPTESLVLSDQDETKRREATTGANALGRFVGPLSPSNAGSVTSEYSAMSKDSPRDSVSGTPNGESASHGLSDEQRLSGNSGSANAPQVGDGYFTSRKRHNINRTDSAPLPTFANLNARGNIILPDRTAKETASLQSLQKPNRESKQSTSTTGDPKYGFKPTSATLPRVEESRQYQYSGTENEQNLSNVTSLDASSQHGNSPQRRRGDQIERPRRQGTHQMLGQGQDRTNRFEKQAARGVPINPPVVAEARANEAEFGFRPPTSKLMRLMIDTGATQEFIADPTTGHITWANSKFLTYRNQTEAEVDRKPWDNIHPKDQRIFRKLWLTALNTGDQVSHQVRLKRFDGQYRWFHIRIVPIKDKYGLVQQWHGQGMDIHEQHIAEVNAAREKEKAASESKYRSLANSNPHIIFAASVPGGMTFANTQWLSYSGQELDHALEFGFLEHVHPDDVLKCRFPALGHVGSRKSSEIESPVKEPYVRRSSASSANMSESTMGSQGTIKAPHPGLADLQAAGMLDDSGSTKLLSELLKDGVINASKDVQGRLSISTEMRLRSKSGEYRWHLVEGSLIESVNFGQGDAQWIIACADITDQKRIENRLKEANISLKLETTRKMQFLSSVSHEIRTPLNGIIGNLQFLMNSPLSEFQSEWTIGANAAARGMHELINDILDVSKAEAKMLRLYFDWFHIRSIIEDVFETLSSKADEKSLDLVYSVSEEVPSQIKGDKGRIRQVLLNLVGNAVKFTQVGEIYVDCNVLKGEIHGSLPKTGQDELILLFNVSDTGSGFSQEDAKILFQPYSQIENSSTQGKGGTGLGLILCKQMVELHGGEISATSVVGKGSTFTFFARFRLPTAMDHPSPEKTAHAAVRSRYMAVRPAIPSTSQKSVLQAGLTESPGSNVKEVDPNDDSFALQSSGSSNPSIDSGLIRRKHSSVSSVEKEPGPISIKSTTPLRSPSGPGEPRALGGGVYPKHIEVFNDSGSLSSDMIVEQRALPPAEPEIFHPPMFSILIICPKQNTRFTTEKHIKQILPKEIPSQVTSNGDVAASQRMIGGDDPIVFTHVVLVLRDSEQILAIMNQILNSISHPHTCVVIVTDQAQKQQIVSGAPEFDYDQLETDRRVRFLLKPAKPPKFAVIFDPHGESAFSTDHSRATAREAINISRLAFMKFEEVLGHKGIKVLAVEDNGVNMAMLNHFLSRVCYLDVELAWNGQQCIDKVLSKDPLYYKIIVCDIQMPVKDGYEACQEVRRWEEENKYPHVPIIALSANIMSEGRRDSSAAGFTNYTTKPVDWKTLGDMIIDLINPENPHIFLRDRSIEPDPP